MLTQPSPSPHGHPVRQHPCFPHRPAGSLSSTRGPMGERRGGAAQGEKSAPHSAAWAQTPEPGSSGSAPPAACIPDVLHGESVKTPDPRVAQPHSCENGFTADTLSTRPGTSACVRVVAGRPRPSLGLWSSVLPAGMRDVWLGSLPLSCVVLPPCSGCEPHDDKAHPGSHMCVTPQSMKNLASDVPVVTLDTKPPALLSA